MKLSSGLKKFLVAFGLVIILGAIGQTSAPKSAVEGTKTIAPSAEPSLKKQEITAPKTASRAATQSPTATPTVKPIQKPTLTPTRVPTKIYVAPTATPTPQATQTTTSNGLSNDSYYTNSAGNQVHSPAYSNSVPAGASAICGDGTYSFSQSRRGTCSHHGGVSQWL